MGSAPPWRDRGREDPLDIGKAENHYRQALGLAEENLTTATAMMREMEIGLWLEKAEAELAAAQ
jgi:hypothetical protein